MTSGSEDSSETDSELAIALARLAEPPGLSPAMLARVKLPGDMSTLELSVPIVEAQEFAPGAIIDARYRVLSVLGRGGMGVVYAAEDLRSGVHVAVKCMSVQVTESPRRAAQVAARFRREARVVASIQHPNVVEVLDAGGASNAPYLVMRLLEGESLRARIARGPIPWVEAKAIFQAVLAGVSAAHLKGIVHRDLKPDNIFLARSLGAQEPVPKVLDFGIASVRDSDAEPSKMTRTGAILGTLSYMAPEQLTASRVDERTDVYALGVVIYEMLSKQLPFSAVSAGALAVLQATSKPIPIDQHRPELPRRAANAVMRALSLKPADRHPDIESYLSALDEHDTARKSYRVRPYLLAAVALVAAGAIAWSIGKTESARPRERAASADVLKLRAVAAEPVASASPVTADAAIQPEVDPPVSPLREAAPARRKRARDIQAERPATQLSADEF